MTMLSRVSVFALFSPAAGIVLEEFKTIPGNNYYTNTIQKYSFS